MIKIFRNISIKNVSSVILISVYLDILGQKVLLGYAPIETHPCD
jgi:hypothetical protein